jgi:hypothetical protein
MSALLPVIQAAIEEGSSGTGVSHYRSSSQCIRRSKLDRAAREAAKGLQPAFDPSSLEGDESAITLGKIFHGLARVYYGDRTNVATEVSDINLGSAADDAIRLFLAYSNKFKPSDFAEIVAVEQPFPRNDSEQELLDYYVGAPFTFRPDMVVRLEAEHCDLLSRTRKLFGLQPGYYLWDFKTMGSKNSHAELFYRCDPQFRGYQACWNWLNQDKPLQGMIADCIVNYKKQEKLEAEGFFSVYVPYPTDKQIDGWRKWIRTQYERSVSAPDDFNMSACFNYHRPCPHLVSGACDQT